MNTEFFAQIGCTFKNQDLVKQAFTHRSFTNEHTGTSHNERLEFLGDAVLELVVTDYLFSEFPDQDEGVLTSWRSALVKGRNLAKVAKSLDLGKYLRMSKGEAKSGGHKKEYLLANVTEALIGAIYLDQGLDQARKFIDQHIIVLLPSIIESNDVSDYKTLLQEYVQNLHSITPHYELISDFGPDHQKTFEMAAKIGDELVGRGTGKNKQEAERNAAKAALELLQKDTSQNGTNNNAIY